MNIEIQSITRRYGKKVALENFSWDLLIRPKLVHGLIGPNGAGKTTIMKILSGIYTYEAGTILCRDIKGDYAPWARNHVAFLPAGERAMRFRNTVYDNALYYSALKGILPQTTRELYARYSEILKMDDFRDRPMGSLSTGEKKKAMLLAALSSGSKIVILDEPSSGLDISAEVDLQNIIKFIGDVSDTCFIISTHDLDFISDIANSYTFIAKGKIADEIKTPLEIEAIRKRFLEINREIPDYETAGKEA